ncbi:Integrin alpha-3 [Thelohanellus kitauei]|uniref:Integrin alpha-3 n=1 Tax=Thelohanellus kitauei TaxID=669202 RepID=A0A0C2JB68_THEKT|nr:Integrin alpha-3 [Thelohanellus kitauei]
MKYSHTKTWVIWGSRHFPGDIHMPPKTGQVAKIFEARSGIAVWNNDPTQTTSEILHVNTTTNKEWIPTIGFASGYLFHPNIETIVIATNDDEEQRGMLFFYNLPSESDKTVPDPIIFDHSWQAIANFGNKIIVVDINNDKYNDLIVTSPTSKWHDLPAVGHVHLFLNSKSKPFFTAKSTVVHGLPVANSFFGWNAEAVDDLDGDGFNDFLVAALKLSENDSRGGVYVFLGGDDKVLLELSYYEVIRPGSGPLNELTGFGFFISSKMGMNEDVNKYIMMSRIFRGEVDVYKTTPHKTIKVTIHIEKNHFLIDEDATIKLSFKHSSNYHSFSDEYMLGTYVSDKKITESIEDQYSVHFRSSYAKLSTKWILQAEITLRESGASRDTNPPIPVFHRIFYHEFSFQKKCNEPECIDDYTVSLRNKPIWYKNSDQPVKFSLRLTNNGDFLTHLIIDAGLLMSCQITIPNTEIVSISNSNPFLLISIKSSIRVVYNQPTPNGIFDFMVQALCPQVNDQTSDLVLKLSIQSFFPHYAKHFDFHATAKNAAEFIIKTKKLSVVNKHVCKGSEFKEIIKFDVELLFGGENYDNELLLSAVLILEESVYKRVLLELTFVK